MGDIGQSWKALGSHCKVSGDQWKCLGALRTSWETFGRSLKVLEGAWRSVEGLGNAWRDIGMFCIWASSRVVSVVSVSKPAGLTMAIRLIT